MSRNLLLGSAAPILALAVSCGPVFAQQAPTPVAGAAAATLGEIVVTAQHRAENLQHAAVVVDAVTGASLAKSGITDSTQLSSVVPGLSAPAFGGGTVSYFIRGVGNFSESAFSDPAIAFNYDGVYIGLPVETAQPFYDLQRVEVLKGPQGTLYGRNATGGAINIIPQTPQLGRYGGYLTTSYGDYGAYNVEGAINTPLGDETAFRLAADFIGHKGYISNGQSDEDTKSVRAQVLSHLTSKLTVRLATDYTDLSGVGAGANFLGDYTYAGPAGYVFHPSGIGATTSTMAPASQAFLQTLSGAPAGRNLGPVTTAPFTNNKLYGAKGDITYDTPAGLLTLIPAWRAGNIGFGYGTVGTAIQEREHDAQESLELRFAGHRIGLFDYTLGALYFHQSEKGTFVVDQQAIDVFQNYDQVTDSYAGFARVTAHLTDQFRVVAGGRYTVDEKHFNGHIESLTIICPRNAATGCPTAPLFPFATTPSGQPLPVPAATGDVLPIVGTGAIVSRADTDVPPSALIDRAPTFRVALEYDLTPRSLLYASVETGYRSGGFSVAAKTATSNGQIYKPEDITAFTLGSKNRFMDNRLELNAEAFIWKYRDQQVSHLTEDAAGTTNNLIQNVGASTNQGVEISTRYLVTPLTVVTANVQYLDAHYDSFKYTSQAANGLPPDTSCPAVQVSAGVYSVNCSGKPSFNAPRYTLDFGVDQTVPLGEYRLVASVNTQYLSSRYVAFDYLPQELAQAVWRSGAQLTLSPAVEKWGLTLYVQNIEGSRYPVNIARFPTGNFLAATTASPRIYGVRLNVNF